ncbi:toll/interleukin-1 receptor domain-containing protein [Actinomadura sp. 6N118]|uniref:toll/interleukin-1 receptor domain-containing protein n=1 Tax=Actinomadura sp. 6N118 TaxID=3375151 RepID=UPI0037BB5E9E
MDTAELIVAVVSGIAGIAAAYFGYVQVRGKLRGRAPERLPPPPQRRNGAPTYDVFVSYAPEDAAWVKEFAERLEQEGVKVAYDEVVLRPGDVRVHQLEEAIRDSAHGLLVFSRASVSDGWAQQDYVTLIERSARTGQRFVPVLIEDDVTLPEFAAIRYHCDFRGLAPENTRYEELIARLAEVLRR